MIDTSVKSNREKMQAAIDIVSGLIVSHGGMLAREQYCPGNNPDESDELIKEHKRWVKELRGIRENLENLFTGAV